MSYPRPTMSGEYWASLLGSWAWVYGGPVCFLETHFSVGGLNTVYWADVRGPRSSDEVDDAMLLRGKTPSLRLVPDCPKEW